MANGRRLRLKLQAELEKSGRLFRAFPCGYLHIRIPPEEALFMRSEAYFRWCAIQGYRVVGEEHQSAAHCTIIFIPSRAIRTSTPSSRATAAIFAASWRSLPVTISKPQCVMIARDTRSFAHQPSWVRTGA